MSRNRTELKEWLKERRITEVELLIPDMAGIARGKILPTNKFLSGLDNDTLRLPESVFGQMVTGADAETETLSYQAPDMILEPDASTICIVPWYREPTAQVICDCVDRKGNASKVAPRQILKNLLAKYKESGWRPVVAPEVEFYLAQRNIDPDYPLLPPAGKSGRPQTGRQAYAIDAVNEFDPMFEDVYDYCEAQEIGIDSLIHEEGVAQCEINFNHGDPLDLADQTFLFKRTVRQAALRHDIYATFMAKPYEQEPGSAMHIHQSIVDAKTGKNLFSSRSGKDTRLFLAYIAGLQKYLPASMPMIAPYVNSYRRLVRYLSAPVNTHWGHENRTVGFRVPESEPKNRRVENRVPGADANPYLAIASTLACGYLGMTQNLMPTKSMEGNAYESMRFLLPRHLLDAIHRFRASSDIRELLGEPFIELYSDVKSSEHDAYQQVISPWERQHLLLNV
ncbi:MAG: glutamine synthetase family protein [Alphaproteobacteria bacterium]|nr:glutamine synthetase family protein [Alphaproteobacteria bacterium]